MTQITNGSRGKEKRKPLLIAAGVLAIAVVAYFTLFYPPVPADDTHGTIGGVKKYHAPQIAEKDVVLAGSNVSEARLIEQAAAGYAEGITNGVRELGKIAQAAKAGPEGAKLEESARELERLALTAKETGKLPEAVRVLEQAREVEKAAESVKSNEAAKLSDLAHELTNYAEGLATLARTEAARTLFDGANELGRMADEGREARKAGNADNKMLSEAALALAQKAEAFTALARTPEAAKTLNYAQEMGRLAERMTANAKEADVARIMEFSREVGHYAEGVRWEAQFSELQRLESGLRDLGMTTEAAMASGDARMVASKASEVARMSDGVEAISRTPEAMKYSDDMHALLGRALEMKTFGRTEQSRMFKNSVQTLGKTVGEAARAENAARAEEAARAGEQGRAQSEQ